MLDRAASTQEAVDLLKEYDMFASSGRDYHFYITDASGDGRVIEYDCDSETRELVDTRSEAVTNFFVLYKDKVARIRRMESTDTEENVTMLFLRLLKQKQNIPILPYGML